MPTPLYNPASAKAAYQLRYSLSAWPAVGRFPREAASLIEEVRPLWEEDGLRLMEHRWTDENVQVMFSTHQVWRRNLSPHAPKAASTMRRARRK